MENPAFIPSAANALDYFNRLNVANTTIALLRKQLASAELLSAANLGVLPILFTPGGATGSGDVAETYANMPAGPARTAFYARHSSLLWAKAEANGGAAE
jgi:hypothetical protein